MNEATITYLLYALLLAGASFGFGYYFGKCRRLGTNTDICGELNQDLGRSAEEISDLETGLGELTEEGKRALDIFRKYITPAEKSQDLELDTSGDNNGKLEFESHNNSIFVPLDNEDE